MLQLQNECFCTPLKVFPKNWNTEKASLKKDWYIYYRFYDPKFRANPKFRKGKLVLIKGMNHTKSLKLRQNGTNRLIEKELQKLQVQGFNPITKLFSQNLRDYLIHPNIGFIEAINKIQEQIKGAPTTKRDLRSIIRFVSSVSRQLGFSELPINKISRKHIKAILFGIEESYGESCHRYNKIRSYLMILFNALVEAESIDVNPVVGISKQKASQTLRKVLSPDDRKRVSNYLHNHHYSFWLFTQIFFHSGSRLTEMMKIKKSDVNMEHQYFTVTVQKGKTRKQVIKPIKSIALPYWAEILSKAHPEQYLFSENLKPGDKPNSSCQVTRRWKTHIKGKLGIQQDFYSLKHLNLDQTASLLSLEDASAMASHSSTGITAKFYALNEHARQLERLKQVQNHFTDIQVVVDK